jgi:subtilase family serine protease
VRNVASPEESEGGRAHGRRSRPHLLALSIVLVVGVVVGQSLSPTGGARTASRPGSELVRITPGELHLGSGTPKALNAIGHGPPTTAECEAAYGVPCYQPAQIQTAYDLKPLLDQGIDGKGETIVIVDAFGSPTIGKDLEQFDKAFGLPAPPSLTVLQPAGPVPPYVADNLREGWAGETDLDVEYSHVMAPGANILLVETPTNENEGTSGFPQIETAEKYVIAHHLGGVISQSFSATEQSFPSKASLQALRGAYVDAAHSGVTVLAASGDSGAADVGPSGRTYYDFPVTSWPDSDPLVTGVGGVQLHLSDSGRQTVPPSAWNDTYNVATQRFITGGSGPSPLAGGGGLSVVFSRPAYQNGVKDVVGIQRGVPDIAMSAACDGAVDVYQGFPGQVGWFPSCGTSEATPLFAGVVALADQEAGHPLGLINSELYSLSASGAPGIVDVTKGNNTVTFDAQGVAHTVPGFSAVAGYDLASGVGTIDAARFVPELVRAAVSPSP